MDVDYSAQSEADQAGFQIVAPQASAVATSGGEAAPMGVESYPVSTNGIAGPSVSAPLDTENASWTGASVAPPSAPAAAAFQQSSQGFDTSFGVPMQPAIAGKPTAFAQHEPEGQQGSASPSMQVNDAPATRSDARFRHLFTVQTLGTARGDGI